jgi:hypothetical protein
MLEVWADDFHVRNRSLGFFSPGSWKSWSSWIVFYFANRWQLSPWEPTFWKLSKSLKWLTQLLTQLRSVGKRTEKKVMGNVNDMESQKEILSYNKGNLASSKEKFKEQIIFNP